MKLVMKIYAISSAMVPNSSDVAVTCSMNDGQMFDALLQFLEHITGEQWAEWQRKIDEDKQ